MARGITSGEHHLIKDIYKDTLRYQNIVCDENKANLGGRGNSIAPAGIVYFSTDYYTDDFSKGDSFQRWLFVHEMMHVWQWGHGVYPVFPALCLWVSNRFVYDLSLYGYDLTPGRSLLDYNMEQQGAIVADYWALTAGTVLRHNRAQKLIHDNPPKNKNEYLPLYQPLISELQSAGPSLSKLGKMPKGIF